MIRLGGIPAVGTAFLAGLLGLGMLWSGVAAASPPDRALASRHSAQVGQAGSQTDPAPVVYITFDDGPHPVYTPQVLDVLAAYGVQATFFVVGSMVSRWPEVARRIASEGHSLQMHSWGHDNLTKFNLKQLTVDTDRTQDVLRDTVRMRATCMRPPYAAVNSRMRQWAAEIDLDIVMWDVSGIDWTDISSDGIARRVLRGVTPGSVVLLHDGGGPRDRTVAALGVILAGLTEAGYRFEAMCSSVPIPEPTCWVFYAWPESRSCPDPSETTAR